MSAEERFLSLRFQGRDFRFPEVEPLPGVNLVLALACSRFAQGWELMHFLDPRASRETLRAVVAQLVEAVLHTGPAGMLTRGPDALNTRLWEVPAIDLHVRRWSRGEWVHACFSDATLVSAESAVMAVREASTIISGRAAAMVLRAFESERQ